MIRTSTTTHYAHCPSPIGELLVLGDDQGRVTGLYVEGEPGAPEGTAFQRQVWAALSEIPYAETLSYRDIAGELGRPQSSRAVGQANGRNPISVIVPCHRVIAADGTLGGYGWGLERKRWLLDHEARVAGRTLVSP